MNNYVCFANIPKCNKKHTLLIQALQCCYEHNSVVHVVRFRPVKLNIDGTYSFTSKEDYETAAE